MSKVGGPRPSISALKLTPQETNTHQASLQMEIIFWSSARRIGFEYFDKQLTYAELLHRIRSAGNVVGGYLL